MSFNFIFSKGSRVLAGLSIALVVSSCQSTNPTGGVVVATTRFPTRAEMESIDRADAQQYGERSRPRSLPASSMPGPSYSEPQAGSGYSYPENWQPAQAPAQSSQPDVILPSPPVAPEPPLNAPIPSSVPAPAAPATTPSAPEPLVPAINTPISPSSPAPNGATEPSPLEAPNLTIPPSVRSQLE